MSPRWLTATSKYHVPWNTPCVARACSQPVIVPYANVCWIKPVLQWTLMQVVALCRLTGSKHVHARWPKLWGMSEEHNSVHPQSCLCTVQSSRPWPKKCLDARLCMFKLQQSGVVRWRYLPEAEAKGCPQTVLTQHHFRGTVDLGYLDGGKGVQTGAALRHRLQADLGLLYHRSECPRFSLVHFRPPRPGCCRRGCLMPGSHV